MGGNIFKDKTKRATRDEYFMICGMLSNVIQDTCGTDKFEYVKAYHSKESFGDIDVVISNLNLSQSYKKNIAARVGEDNVSSNGGVFSFVYREMQVDLIVTQDKYFESSLNYFAYNDFSNITGRICHKMGFKLGHKGLSLVVREPVDEGSHILAEIELTTDYFKSLEILGLDRKKYENGFHDLEDIFNYVASSPYFDPDIYLLDNRSHYSRVRDRKRKTYHEFLEWIKNNDVKGNFDFADKTERGGYNIREPFYTEVVLKHFPWVDAEVKDAIANYEFDKNFKKVYNGELVGECTGLSGKELGMFMTYLRPLLTDHVKEQMMYPATTPVTFVTNNYRKYKVLQEFK